MRPVALAAAVLVLLAPAEALAHGSIAPTSAASGSSQRFVVTIPNSLQGGPRIIGVTVMLPEGASVETAEAGQPRWQASVDGRTIMWQGGPLEGLSEDFAFTARLPDNEGTLAFRGQELYAAGAGPLFPLAVTLARGSGSGSVPAARVSDDDLAWVAIALAGTALLLAAGAAALAGALWHRQREAGG